MAIVRRSLSHPLRDEPDGMLPQPLLRFVGVAFIGLGTGLTNANVPWPIVVAAFLPAIVALGIITIRTSMGTSIAEPVEVSAVDQDQEAAEP